MNRLAELLERFAALHLTVWGDFVADEFVGCDIARVSREAPVLILRQRERQIAPGGAANAAANLAALGVAVQLLGAVGDDEPGERLLEQFHAAGMDTAGILRIHNRPTPVKSRILAGHAHTKRQQVLRLDREPEVLAAAAQNELLARARAGAGAAHAFLLSDYGYGSVSPPAAQALRTSFPQLLISVDARFRIQSYTDLTAATPNEPELEEALHVAIGNDLDELERAGRQLLGQLRCQHLLVTRGRDGMALFAPHLPTQLIPVVGSRQAVDVTGAGDTVIAVFTAALAAGASGGEAARLANCAGGCVVMKPGTATLSREELFHAIAVLPTGTSGE